MPDYDEDCGGIELEAQSSAKHATSSEDLTPADEWRSHEYSPESPTSILPTDTPFADPDVETLHSNTRQSYMLTVQISNEWSVSNCWQLSNVDFGTATKCLQKVRHALTTFHTVLGLKPYVLRGMQYNPNPALRGDRKVQTTIVSELQPQT